MQIVSYGAMLVLAIGMFLGGMGFEHVRSEVRPWDDGLVVLSCFTDGKSQDQTVRGVGFFDDPDNGATHVIAHMPFDPKTSITPDDKVFDVTSDRFPLGCYVRGIQQKDIVRRTP